MKKFQEPQVKKNAQKSLKAQVAVLLLKSGFKESGAPKQRKR